MSTALWNENNKPEEYHNITEIVEKIYSFTKMKNEDIFDPQELKKIRVPSGANIVNKVYELIDQLPDEEINSEIKVAIADLLWFFQKRDIEDDYLGDCDVRGRDDWHTNLWAGYYQHFVPTVGCDSVYRAGLMGDGGKHLCNVHKLMRTIRVDEQRDECMVYSFGTFNDISFDNQMYYLLNCRSHAFDPTISPWQLKNQLNDHVTFHEYGIGPSYKDSWTFRDKPLKSMEMIAKELGDQRVDIMKIDVEGNEIPVFDHIFNKEHGILEKLKVKLILVEYHSPPLIQKEMFDKKVEYDCHDRKNHLYPFLKSFYDAGFYMYRFEHNVYDVSCIEYGFIHRDMI